MKCSVNRERIVKKQYVDPDTLPCTCLRCEHCYKADVFEYRCKIKNRTVSEDSSCKEWRAGNEVLSEQH